MNYLPKDFEINNYQVNFNNIKYTPVLDISEPLLLSFEFGDSVYLLYVISHKKISKKIKFLLIASDYRTIKSVVNEEEPLLSLFENSNNIEEYTFSQKDNQNKRKKINYVELQQNGWLPEESFFLDKKYPNQVNLDLLKKKIALLSYNFQFRKKIYDLPNFVSIDSKYEENIDMYVHINTPHENLKNQVQDNFFKGQNIFKYDIQASNNFSNIKNYSETPNRDWRRSINKFSNIISKKISYKGSFNNEIENY